MGIEVRGIRKSFPSPGADARQGRLLVLDRTDLTIADHEFVSLLGSSGCGKTTLLKIMDGLVRPDAGQILIGGRPVSGPGPDRAMVFQDAALLPWADIATNVAFGLELRGVQRAERLARSREIIAAVGLKGFEASYPHQLSGGMQQRAGLARAFAVDPDVLLMDEPFGALDALTRQVLQEELLDLWQDRRMTVVFVTHSIEEAVFLSDRIAVMTPRPGRVAEIVEVRLPRPRSLEEVRATREFSDVCAHLWELLKRLLDLPTGGARLLPRAAEGA